MVGPQILSETWTHVVISKMSFKYNFILGTLKALIVLRKSLLCHSSCNLVWDFSPVLSFKKIKNLKMA